MDMSNATTPTYAETLVSLVFEAFDHEPERYAGCRTFQDLHDVCDANEFIIDADEAHGFDYDPSDDAAYDAYCTRVNAACDAVDAAMAARVPA